MSERLEIVDEYMKAKFNFDKAKMVFDLTKERLKEFGTFSEGGVIVDVSVVGKESLSIKKLTEYNPDLVRELRELGVITKSESDRLTVKVLEDKELR